MFTSIGPWGVGPKTAHFLLLLLSYRLNVNSGISRLGNHNFGHKELHLIDRLQNRYQELFNVLVFPRHRNLSLFKAIADFVAIGIGPVSLNPDFVKMGEPMAHLKGDLRFMAERMKLNCPPLPIGGRREEIRMFSTFMSLYPKASDANWRKLSKLFLKKSNGKTIFPKLPSMLKSYHSRWQQNQVIKQLEKKLETPINEVLQQLHRARSAPTEPEPVLHVVTVAVNVPQRNFVPSVAAAQQSAFLESANSKRAKQGQRCYYEPFCDSWADDCGGVKVGNCSRVNNGNVKIPSDQTEFQRQKDKAVKDRRALERKQKRVIVIGK